MVYLAPLSQRQSRDRNADVRDQRNIRALTTPGLQNSIGKFWTWLLFTSLCVRNPFIVHGGDDLLKMMLFWGIFVPWGARYSVDSSLNPTPGALPQSVFSIAR